MNVAADSDGAADRLDVVFLGENLANLGGGGGEVGVIRKGNSIQKMKGFMARMFIPVCTAG